MEQLGTPMERAAAKRWLEAHPTKLLSRDDILATDDSAYGPSENALDKLADEAGLLKVKVVRRKRRAKPAS